jgi:catechol 2,3-dioxygenase-like lactoylglutathione lyase family enzyme
MCFVDEIIISGIQQIGIGVPDVDIGFKWYRMFLGADIPAFDDTGKAGLMTQYTGGKPHQRRALLALNLQGGSGFEIWQYTDREPQKPSFSVKLGDRGIFAARIKAHDLDKSYAFFRSEGISISGNISQDPAGNRHFFIKDPFSNIFQVVSSKDWFSRNRHFTGEHAAVLSAFLISINLSPYIRISLDTMRYCMMRKAYSVISPACPAEKKKYAGSCCPIHNSVKVVSAG